MPVTVIVRNISKNSIGFDLDPTIMRSIGVKTGEVVKIQILQIMHIKKNEIIELSNIFMIKKIVRGPCVILKAKLAKSFNILEGDALTIEILK